MTRTPKDVPEAELAVLELLWQAGPATRRQLADVLYPGGTASQYATVQKLLERLEHKGCVRREGDAGGWRFSAVVSRDELISRRIEEVVDRLCGGSLTPLLLNLVKTRPLTAEQLNELRQFVRAGEGVEAMTQTLLQAGLVNAGLALVLAIPAALASRFLRRWPALAHGLWLLVLLKLITPPLLEVPRRLRSLPRRSTGKRCCSLPGYLVPYSSGASRSSAWVGSNAYSRPSRPRTVVPVFERLPDEDDGDRDQFFRGLLGPVRKIAAALSVPVATLLEIDPVHPGDAAHTRADRLSAAIRDVMWVRQPMAYASPVDAGPRDDIADMAPDDFFADMPPLDARRG